MRNIMLYILLLFSLVGMAGCDASTSTGFFNPGDPENQLVTQTEQEFLDLSTPNGLSELKALLARETPKEAVINCSPARSYCKKATEMLNKAGIPHHGKPEGSILTLYYEKIIGKDCYSGYIDNSKNHYNQNHRSFGCSMRANTVQMVSDKQQFINPRLLDYMDGEKAAQVYDSYVNPPEEVASQATTTDSLVTSSSQ